MLYHHSRPSTIEELAHQEETVKTLKTAISSGNLPHLLFYGPPGTGKTSAILAVARQLFGPKLFRSRILELNASDERGINIVREKIKKFAQKKIARADTLEEYDSRYPCPSIQIIILDEADSMTGDAQAALRRVIENYTKTTRFCILCNYISKIIDPIVSRCMKFRFNPITAEAQIEKLKNIAKKENVMISDPCLSTLIRLSEGDMRKSITALQCAARGKEKVILEGKIVSVMGVVPENIIEEIIKNTREKSTEELVKLTDDIICAGYSVATILSEIVDYLQKDLKLSEPQIAKIAWTASEVEHKLIEGGSENINLLNLLMNIKDITH